jgi:putative endonuclease
MAAETRPSGSAPADRRRALGAAGEAAVARHYEARGYEVLDRNWRRRSGEIDLVLHRDRVLVFCEVKTRSSRAFGIGAEAVTREKRQRLRLLAGAWLEENKVIVRQLRFDVASVSVVAPRKFEIDIIEGAF